MNKNQMAIVLLAAYLSMTPLTSHADVVVRLSGEVDSSIITVDVSGSGTWSNNRNSAYMMWASTSNFIPDSLSMSTSVSNVDAYLALTPIGTGIVMDYGSTQVNLDRVYFDHDAGANSDDFGLGTSAGKFKANSGDSYRISGSATIDLSVLSTDFVFGDFENTVFSEPSSSGHLVGALNGTVVEAAAMPVSAVPLPASAALFLPGALGLVGFRKLKRQHYA